MSVLHLKWQTFAKLNGKPPIRVGVLYRGAEGIGDSMTDDQLEAFAERIRQETLASIYIGVHPEEHGTAW